MYSRSHAPPGIISNVHLSLPTLPCPPQACVSMSVRTADGGWFVARSLAEHDHGTAIATRRGGEHTRTVRFLVRLTLFAADRRQPPLYFYARTGCDRLQRPAYTPSSRSEDAFLAPEDPLALPPRLRQLRSRLLAEDFFSCAGSYSRKHSDALCTRYEGHIYGSCAGEPSGIRETRATQDDRAPAPDARGALPREHTS